MSMLNVKVEQYFGQGYNSENLNCESYNEGMETHYSGSFSPYSKPHVGDSPVDVTRCKRRVLFGQKSSTQDKYSSSPSSPVQPASVVRRNERERNRVRMVNNGFATLRQHVPNGVKNKKMSKVETLKSAVDYIRELQEMLMQGDSTSLSVVKSEIEQNEQCQQENRTVDFHSKSYNDREESRKVPHYQHVAYDKCEPDTFSQAHNYPNAHASFYSSNGSPALSWPSDTSSPHSQGQQDDENIMSFSSWFS